MRRVIDLALSASALVLISPLLLVIGALVACTSPGGPLFRQTRVGRYRRPFTLLKFRSMSVHPGTEEGSFDPGDHRRVAGVGRVLRRFKLDELPQLWNVLVGDMSLVGPRPEVPEWTEIHPEEWDVVLSVRPGLTDPASLEFRHEETLLARSDDPRALYRDVILPRKLELSGHYVRHRTMGGDMALLLRTVLALPGRPTGSRVPDPGQSDR